jgi:hypothetical protein
MVGSLEARSRHLASPVYTREMIVAPAFAVPPHLRHGAQGELHAWFTDPPGAVMQLSMPQHFTVEQAEWLVGPALDRLRERFPNETKLILVLDYRNMTSRDPRARSIMMERASEIADLFGHITVVPPEQPNPVYRTMLHAAVALVSAFGTPVEIMDSFDDVIEQRGLRAQPE